jgi:class 3 adenylate cyclase
MNDSTVRAKYIFLDIVGYSHNRSVEAQTEVISVLNAIVLKALVESGIKQDGQILLPTGDGICIAIVDVSASYDIHLRIALIILRELRDHNTGTPDAMRRFEVRIGLNENVDNKIIDINGKPNIAGAGINLAQRIMSAADGNQVLVGDAVYETLRHREHYMNKFRSHSVLQKHTDKEFNMN